MKRVKASLIIIVILILICGVLRFISHNIADDMIDTVTQAKNSIVFHDETSGNRIEKIKSKWDNYECALLFFINHKELDTISHSVGMISHYYKSDNQESFFSECEALILTLESFKTNEKISLVNIF